MGTSNGELGLQGVQLVTSAPVPDGFSEPTGRRSVPEGSWGGASVTVHRPANGDPWHAFLQLAQSAGTPREAARQTIACHLGSGLIPGADGSVLVEVDRAERIDGHDGWHLGVIVPTDQAPGGGVRVDAVAVMSTGALDEGAVLWGSAAVSDTSAQNALDTSLAAFTAQG